MNLSSPRSYVTRGTTRRSKRSGATFAAARGHVKLEAAGVRVEVALAEEGEADRQALADAVDKRARKQARRAALRAPNGQEA